MPRWLQPIATMAYAGRWAPPPGWLESAATGTGSPTLREGRAPAAKSHPTGTTVRGTPRTARRGPACPASAPACAARDPDRRIPESSACLRKHASQFLLGLEQPSLGRPLRDLENGRDLGVSQAFHLEQEEHHAMPRMDALQCLVERQLQRQLILLARRFF